MIKLDRREFVQASMASVLSSALASSVPSPETAKIHDRGKSVSVEGSNYAWEWSEADDQFRLLDKEGRIAASGKLQAAVLVQRGSEPGSRICIAGKPAGHVATKESLTCVYEGVNGGGKQTVTLRFDENGFWMEPIAYESSTSENVVALHYFSEGTGETARPGLENSYLLLPGISMSSGVSPIVTASMGLELTSWLGRGTSPVPGWNQQWALPVHYFCGLHRNRGGAMKSTMTKYLSQAFCCGLASLPNGDLFFETNHGRHSLIVSYRSDIWGHLKGPGRLTLGAKLYWTLGENYYEAIRAYYQGLMQAGIIKRKTNSAKKNSAILATQFNTWGAQLAEEKAGSKLDDASLDLFYRGLRESGMKSQMFTVDLRWEGRYGSLRHAEGRLARFMEFREKLRGDGMKLGMWAAFMLCEEPAALGLDLSHMLHLPDGTPVISDAGDAKYYTLDFTQPEVERVLDARAKEFVERYEPDLVKFDFGYAMPPLSVGAPRNMQLAGERMVEKGLEVVVNGMRKANPDIAIMYYNLSPLFTEYIDLHSIDDLWAATGEYDLEANRRFFFSSLMGDIGIPTYGSGGYDWNSMPEIWFDSALIGTLGSLNSFTGDEQDSAPTPERIAKFNGLSQCLRTSNNFSIEPLDVDYFGVARGCRASSWARFENGELVSVALRAHRFDGRAGSGKYRRMVQTSASVVVASKTDEGLAQATRLAVVPYGDGELTIRREDLRPSAAQIRQHCFGGQFNESRIDFRGGVLRLPLRDRDARGLPVEWIEVEVRPA